MSLNLLKYCMLYYVSLLINSLLFPFSKLYWFVNLYQNVIYIFFILLQKTNILQKLSIPSVTMLNCLRQIESRYNSTAPFHNSIHALDVLHATYQLFQCNSLKVSYTWYFIHICHNLWPLSKSIWENHQLEYWLILLSIYELTNYTYTTRTSNLRPTDKFLLVHNFPLSNHNQWTNIIFQEDVVYTQTY